MARDNRAFLRRAVRLAASRGVRQFLDIGSGIPTEGNVHEAARAAAPDARVVYVDVDPTAVIHSRQILGDDPRTVVLQADLHQADRILDDPSVRALVDFDRPVCLLLVAMLHFIPDSPELHTALRRYRDALVPGSLLAVSHGTPGSRPDRLRTLAACMCAPARRWCCATGPRSSVCSTAGSCSTRGWSPAAVAPRPRRPDGRTPGRLCRPGRGRCPDVISGPDLDTHRVALTGYCYRMLGSAFDAEDAVQETMLRAWRAPAGSTSARVAADLAVRIATNVCMDVLRARRRRARAVDLAPAAGRRRDFGAPLPESALVRPVPDARVLPAGGDPADLAVQRERSGSRSSRRCRICRRGSGRC